LGDKRRDPSTPPAVAGFARDKFFFLLPGGGFEGFSLSLALPTEADADRVFAALADGGTIRMPLSKTFWSPRFGMLTDRFGVGWMVTVGA